MKASKSTLLKKKLAKKTKVLVPPPTLKVVSLFIPTKNKTDNKNRETDDSTKLKSSESHMPRSTQSSSNYRLLPNERVYAEGFSPESKLIKFLKIPVPPKTTGLIVSLLVACCVVAIGISVSPLFYQTKSINQAAIIKTAQTIKTVSIVAGGQPVQWSVLVKKSDITNKSYLAKLPKNAKNIKITTITASQAKDILKTPPKQQLSLQQKNQIAKSNQPKSFFAAGLIDSIGKFFLSDLSDGVQTIVDSINPDIQTTSEATVVDLSSQAPAVAPSADGATAGQSQPETPAPAEIPSLTETTSPASNEAINIPLDETVSSSEQPAINPTPNLEDSLLPEATPEQSVVKVDYQTPAPQITEQNTDTGKLVTVSAPTETPDQPPITDVLASTKIPKIYKVGQEDKIHIKWKNNGNQNVTFTALDTNGDGYLDYVEWTIPHLSDQEFEIIFISKAFQLDSDQNIVADIYQQVQTQDNVFATVPATNYVRATFYETLDNTKDITIYAKATDPNTPVSINVYPVYTDSDGNQTEGPQLTLVNDGTDPDFSNITTYQKYRILLQNLQTPTDMFDLKVEGGNIEIDYIVDPSTGDSFVNETLIGGGVGRETANVINTGSGITIAPCYTANPASPGWVLTATTSVRDVTNAAYNSYITKYIYCDSYNCIFYANNSPGPTPTECIGPTGATGVDANVYENLLWSKTDASTGKTWGPASSILTTDIGGTFSSAYNSYTFGGNAAIGADKNWLERYYTSPAGTYLAMDACKAAGLGWRLPNILELDSIRDMGTGAGPYSRLPGITSTRYWSSSEGSSTNAWLLGFGSGDVGASFNLAKSNSLYVRCVRGY